MTRIAFARLGIHWDVDGDDLVVPISSIAYDPGTWSAVAVVDGGALPLVDGMYRFVVEGDDPDFAIQDLVGNPAGDGADSVLQFALNTPPLLHLPVVNEAAHLARVHAFGDLQGAGRVVPGPLEGEGQGTGVCGKQGQGDPGQADQDHDGRRGTGRVRRMLFRVVRRRASALPRR